MISIHELFKATRHVGIERPEAELQKAERMILSSAPLDDFADILDICLRRGWITTGNHQPGSPDPAFIATDEVKAWAQQIVTTNAHFRQMLNLHIATGHTLDDDFAVMVLTEVVSGQHGSPDLLMKDLV